MAFVSPDRGVSRRMSDEDECKIFHQSEMNKSIIGAEYGNGNTIQVPCDIIIVNESIRCPLFFKFFCVPAESG